MKEARKTSRDEIFLYPFFLLTATYNRTPSGLKVLSLTQLRWARLTLQLGATPEKTWFVGNKSPAFSLPPCRPPGHGLHLPAVSAIFASFTANSAGGDKVITSHVINYRGQLKTLSIPVHTYWFISVQCGSLLLSANYKY